MEELTASDVVVADPAIRTSQDVPAILQYNSSISEHYALVARYCNDCDSTILTCAEVSRGC